jgi:hypothetical protein
MARPKKPGEREKITAYIPVDLATALRIVAVKQRRTISTVVEAFIRDGLAAHAKADK